MQTPFIHRTVLDDLRRDMRREEIAFLIGPRQAGKTTLMRVLQKELENAGEQTLYLSLDFDEDRVFFDSQLSLLRKVELELGQGPGYVFIDEIQRREDAGLFLKGLQDRDLPFKFIVSGSGSVDLKAKVKESMLGRKRVYNVFPLSLREFVDHRTGDRYSNRMQDFLNLEKDRAEGLLDEYMRFGGYPRVVLEQTVREKRRVMDDIYQGYILKDISYWLKVDKIEAYGQLIRALASQIGQLLNYSELASTLGITATTVKNYCWYAEETYVLRRVTPFFRNVRSEISKAPMVYFSDPGFRNFALGILGNPAPPDDLGLLFQNLVFRILHEKLQWTGARIHFWRTTAKSEIDFVIDTGRHLIPVEVKHALMKPTIPRAIHGFASKYKPIQSLMINRSLRETVKLKHTTVRFVTIWDLLLQDPQAFLESEPLLPFPDPTD